MAYDEDDSSVPAVNNDALLTGVLNSSHDGIAAFAPVFDDAGKIIDFTYTVINLAAERIARMSSADLVGKRLLVEMPRHAELGLFDAFVSVIETGVPFVDQYRYDDGKTEYWLHTTAVRFADGIAVTFRNVTETVQLHRSLEHQAGHDPLTGLANRTLLEDRISHALAGLIRRPRTVTLLFLDLDRFKLINDGLGHASGDSMLIQFADRVGASMRPTDTMARLDGDEFVLLLDDIDADHLGRITDRILAMATQPYRIKGRDVLLAVTIGVAQTVTSDTTPSNLIAEADRAMSQAKQLGGNRVGFADPASAHASEDRLDLEVQLHHALESDQLRLAYQPVVDCRSGLIVGAEALIRWEHPTRGMVQPDNFLPVAEATGLIRPIGKWVLREATRQLAEWSADVDGTQHLFMAVNASADQLIGRDFPAQIRDSLEDHGIEAHRLCIEVTETALIRDPSAARSTLNEISQSGVSIALDDFGTGYSPLTYLQQFPVDTIKIDRSFITDADVTPQDAVLVTAVIEFATALNKKVTAEGIETLEQLQLVQDAHNYQGYLFSRPIWADEFATLVQDQFALQ